MSSSHQTGSHSIDLNRDLRDYLSKNSVSNSQPAVLGGFNLGKWLNSKSGGDGYMSVPTVEPTEANNHWWFNNEVNEYDDKCFPTLSKKQRVIGCIICASLGMFCMGMASLLIPFLILRARKFAMLYTLGSLFLISSFSVLWGPCNHIKHLCTAQRIPFTVAYFGTMLATIYFSIVAQNTLATVLCAIAQIFALVWYVASYLPGGQTGLKFFSKVFSSGVASSVKRTLPV